LNNSINFDGIEVYPTKIVCVGRNYVGHIEELGNEVPAEPVIFLKPNSSISNDIWLNGKNDIHYEAEITFLIQSGELASVGFGLDLTKRDVQTALKNKGLPWERSKAFDKSAVFSDFVALPGDIKDLSMQLYINDQLIQQAEVSLMLYKPEELLNEIGTFITMEDGDILMTGTPSGVGKVEDGDRFAGKIVSGKELLVEGFWLAKNDN